MGKPGLHELSTETLIKRKKDHRKRYFISMVLLSIMTLYLLYLDFIKKSDVNHFETYIFIAIGIAALSIEVVYITRKINSVLKLR